jgi:protein involved in polysaccharide export with SLBB domain
MVLGRICDVRRKFVVTALIQLMLGCAQQAHRPSVPVAASDVMPDDTLGTGDVLEARVVGEPDITGAYAIGVDGTVDIPFAGRLRLLGLRPGEVQRLITEKLKDGYIRQPQVTVTVKEWNSRKVSVLGQVAKPGPILFFPRMTIVDAIAAAGGFTPIAAPNSVRLRREVKGKVESRTYRVADISEGKSENITIAPGDVLVVDERMF